MPSAPRRSAPPVTSASGIGCSHPNSVPDSSCCRAVRHCWWRSGTARCAPAAPRSRWTAGSPPDRGLAHGRPQFRSPASTPSADPGCTITAMNPLSGVLDEAWRMYKTFAKHLLAIAFVIYLVAAIITALLALAGGTVGILLGSFVSVVAAFVLQATLVKAVQDVRDGHADLSIRQTVNEALPFLASVAGASILAGIAITIGLVLIIVPGLFLITIWAVIVPVIIIERSGALASFGRSRQLVRGHGG